MIPRSVQLKQKVSGKLGAAQCIARTFPVSADGWEFYYLVLITMRRGRNDDLFRGADWIFIEGGQKRALHSEIDGIDRNRILNTSIDDLCDYFEEKFHIDVPVLHADRIVAVPSDKESDRGK